ncbi:hypothetical protein [Streptomyces sp. NPDC056491]|uniref:hypothetical protein n=1 Tax=Streptomyces sp. NPDC056491 TaxID=3345837 RepID=UPI00367D6F93
MVGSEDEFAVGEVLLVEVGGFLISVEVVQGVGEVVAVGEGVGVVVAVRSRSVRVCWWRSAAS